MADVLTKILDYKLLETESKKRATPQKDLELKARDVEPTRPFLSNFNAGINIIAEIKKASPSAGVIREDFHPVDIAHVYEDCGAKAVSVLTDEHFFQGHLSYLTQVKQAVKLPTLRKDFTVKEYNIFEARAAEADAVLLIVAALDDYELKDFHQLTQELGMVPLVEVHNLPELNRALALPLKLLGINNRNLKTMTTTTQTTLDLLPEVDTSKVTVISESGLKDHQTLMELRGQGVEGFLIGESLMREKAYGTKLKEMIG